MVLFASDFYDFEVLDMERMVFGFVVGLEC